MSISGPNLRFSRVRSEECRWVTDTNLPIRKKGDIAGLRHRIRAKIGADVAPSLAFQPDNTSRASTTALMMP